MNINHTRDLVRMANTYYDCTGVSKEQRQEDLQHVALCTWAFVRAMKRHLSPEEEDEQAFRKELYEKLPEQQAERIIAAAHRPNRALQDLSFAIDDLPMHFVRKNEVHQAVTIFEDDLGSSERLLTSPVPLFYSRHTARFISVWLFLLPLGLYDPFKTSWNHVMMIPATFVLSFFLFGIEELATQLEEPFTILPMQAFCDKIYNWCMEIMSCECQRWQMMQIFNFFIYSECVNLPILLSAYFSSTGSPGDNGREPRPVLPQHKFFLNSPPGSGVVNGGAIVSPVATVPPPAVVAPAPVAAPAFVPPPAAVAPSQPAMAPAAGSSRPAQAKGDSHATGGGVAPPSGQMTLEDFLKSRGK